ncbi:MAG TPA: non-homologous end-joining DNA ligase [Candidatus Acidoferrales bacterium]|nr:non-homologous end-joining DNA ligase [Candidatus Acidoferrales bacterium]
MTISDLRLTNLDKIFFPERGLTKGDLLAYYETVAPALLAHLRGRAIVMKRYPDGVAGPSFYMKRTPKPHPAWLQTCTIEHASGNVIDFPVIADLPSLLWIVNLGCIDLHPWYGTCDDVNRPDALHFDLDPAEGATFATVCEVALLVRKELAGRGFPCYAKTSGSTGIHIAVPIVRGPRQKDVWSFAKAFARELEKRYADLVTSEYRVTRRPLGHVLIDYNQNAWGRTLASVYSVRPVPRATVSTPVTWEEIERGISTDDFDIETVPRRIDRLGDLWKPMCAPEGRARLEVAS